MELFPKRPRFEALLPHECVDGKQLFVFTDEFICNTPNNGQVVIPVGFITDFASIPGIAKGWLDDDDPRILCPSCIHDFRYKMGFDRKKADQELCDLMSLCGARRTMGWTVKLMVRIFGGTHWQGTVK